MLVNFSVVGLNKNHVSIRFILSIRNPFFQQPITYLALQANVRDFTKSPVISTRSITVQGVTIRIGMGHAQNNSEVDFIL